MMKGVANDVASVFSWSLVEAWGWLIHVPVLGLIGLLFLLWFALRTITQMALFFLSRNE